MDFALQASGILLTWNIDPMTAQSIAITFWALFGWLAIIWIVILIIISIFMIVAYRKLFEKAGKPWRSFFIPFYNQYLMFKIWGRPGWWFVWMLVPPVLMALSIILCFDIAKRFNKHRTFWLWIRLIPIVFIPMIAFDKDITYTPKEKSIL